MNFHAGPKLAFAVLAGLVLFSGCANPPRFVKRTPVLRLLYRPWSKPFLDHPQFSFYIKRDWNGPISINGGVRYFEPKKRAWITVQFLMSNMEGYKSPNRYRKFMREQGTIGDSHILDTIEISSRTADVARFTTYDYAPEYMLGESYKVLMTEMTMIPDPAGVYVLRYEAPRRYFSKFYKVQKEFINSLAVASPREEEESDPIPWLKK